MRRFADRRQAGRLLGAELRGDTSQRTTIVALPPGGVPVGFEVALALRAPLDLWVVLEVGLPRQPELGRGAVAEGGYVHLGPKLTDPVGLSRVELERRIADAGREVEARVRLFRGDRERPPLGDRNVIVVDDGSATGETVAAAIGAIRGDNPLSVSLAVPVAAVATLRELARTVDRVTCLDTPRDLLAIGDWYEDFSPVEDAEILALMRRASQGTEA